MSWVGHIPYPMAPPRKKIHAQYPDIREEICDHKHASYTGTMPCTGWYACLMCGLPLMEYVDLVQARRVLEDGFRTMFEEMRV